VRQGGEFACACRLSGCVGVIGVIGGSGWESFPDIAGWQSVSPETPYGQLAEPIKTATWQNQSFAFLSRHGAGHALAPHEINYQANIWALKSLGVQSVLSINAVGGIAGHMAPESLVAPDQLIDYTWGRAHSFWQRNRQHVDFTEPFAGPLRARLLAAAGALNVSMIDGGTYGCTQGPRLETAAEIRRMARDGCDLVGMTAMPEAALARELELDYASVCIVVNWAAGLSSDAITLEAIYQILANRQRDIQALLGQVLCAGELN
jgi:5'-methylthioinosine phosphorylase